MSLPFSRKIFHTLEAVTYIALHHTTHPISGRTLADIQQLPPRYLEPNLQMLAQKGILRSIRGPRGGYLLAKERRRITLGDVYTLLNEHDEEPGHTGELSALAAGVLLPSCREAAKTLLDELHKITLAQLCEQAYALQLSQVTTSKPSAKGAAKKLDYTI